MIGPPAGTLRWIERLLVPLPRGGAILDLGCGGGEPIARYLIDHGFHVTGVDIDAHAIGLAQTRFPRARWRHGDMRDIALDETFDGVLAWDCLAALPHADQGAMAERAAAWLKPGGRLLFNAVDVADPAVADYRAGSPYGDAIGPADYSRAIVARGLIEMAHVAHDPACGGLGVWLARKG